MDNYIEHHGILGQKWGVRRYQNEDGTLTDAGRRRLEKKDSKWAHKNYDKIYSKAYKKSEKELKSYGKQLSRSMPKYTKSGKVTSSYALAYNQKMAALMTQKVSDIRSPSGQVINFVAKRGELGVHMALATPNYDLSDFNRRGIYESGKVAYKKQNIERM